MTVTARDVAGTVAIDITDQGSLRDGDPLVERDRMRAGGDGERAPNGHGIGLPLAADLAASAGGRMVLARRRPTTFTLFLPPVEPGADVPPLR